MVKVSSGANTQDMELAGKTIAEVKQELKDVLNISDDANAVISGDNVETTYVLQNGDVLEFIKKSGDKGR
jgi:hypothetical protein